MKFKSLKRLGVNTAMIIDVAVEETQVGATSMAPSRLLRPPEGAVLYIEKTDAVKSGYDD
jgi:hypothetical protein